MVIVSGFCFSQCTTRHNIQTGAQRTREYIPMLAEKKVGVVANHTSLVNGVHLVDTLLAENIEVTKIFSPEHGFRGDKDAGAYVSNYKDKKTGLPVISLYGKRKKPKTEDLTGLDIVVFDIQDVGVRFYTYISTMHYVMEACAETGTPLLVLDRPNPNGFYIDGPVLDTMHQSFVGMHPIPLVHGMTIAELARMINTEGWLSNANRCDLKWVKCANYTHDSLYQLPVKPSPNLPNMRSVYLYPSLGLFEGTIINVGRGTLFPFQVFGHPSLEKSFSYTPRPIKGASSNPKHKGQKCYGVDLREIPMDTLTDAAGVHLNWLKLAYEELGTPEDFFLPFFNYLSGSTKLQKALEAGASPAEIKKSWQKELDQFARKREKYLLYEDFSK